LRGDRERLADIQQAIERIERHTRGGRASLDDELIQVWVIHNLEILGEAARGVSAKVRERHPDLPWRSMIGMRDVLAHGYFAIDVDRVWLTITRDLPAVKERLAAIIAAIDAAGDARAGASS
jgi:uncharacterized protein with HEPN domain